MNPFVRFALGMLVIFPALRTLRGLAFGVSIGAPIGASARLASTRAGNELMYSGIGASVAAVAIFFLVGRLRRSIAARAFVARMAAAGLVAAVVVELVADGGSALIVPALVGDYAVVGLAVLVPRTWKALGGLVALATAFEVFISGIGFLSSFGLKSVILLPAAAFRSFTMGTHGLWALVLAHLGVIVVGRWLLRGAVPPANLGAGLAARLREIGSGRLQLAFGADGRAQATTAPAATTAPTVTCPHCEERIAAKAVRCPFCAEPLTSPPAA